MASTSSGPSPAEPLSQIPCGICRRQFSKYICPKCNLTYCSLTCFRSEAHAECSESFYRKEVEVDIKTAPAKTTEERLRMMELLKRFEEDSLDDEGDILKELADEEDEDDGDNLANRLGNVDLDAISPDELWSMLTSEERDKFIKAVGDPNSDLAQQLLASEELEKVRTEPWWENPNTDEDISSASSRLQKRYGKKPEITIRVPANMIKTPAPSSGPSLLYNVCALCIAYAYTTRHLAISPLSSSPSDAADVLAMLLPFLVERKSTAVYTSLSAVVTDLWARLGQDQMIPPLVALLLHDTAMLVRPSRVIEIEGKTYGGSSDMKSHSNSDLFRVLSDISSVFDQENMTKTNILGSKSKPKPKPNHIAHKLAFYAVRVLSTPGFILDALADEAVLQSRTMCADIVPSSDAGPRREIENIHASSDGLEKAGAGAPPIEELQ